VKELLLRLEFAAIQGMVALVVVAIVTAIFPKLSANLKAWLWRLALLRFLIALGFDWRWELFAAPPAEIASSPQSIVRAEIQAEPAPHVNAMDVLFALWALPAFGLFVSGLCKYGRLKSIANQAKPLVPGIKVSEAIQVPCLVGLWQSLILLPLGLIHPEKRAELAMSIAHESAHRERWDPLFSLLHFLIGCTFWFVLPLWFALREYNVQSEMDCDRRALRSTQLSARQYGNLLVAFATQSPNPVGVLAMSGASSDLKRRLKAMNQHPSHHKLTTLALVTMLGAVLVVPVRAVQAPAKSSPPAPATAKDQILVVQKQLNDLQVQIQTDKAITPAKRAKLRAKVQTIRKGLQRAKPLIEKEQRVVRALPARVTAPKLSRALTPRSAHDKVPPQKSARPIDLAELSKMEKAIADVAAHDLAATDTVKLETLKRVESGLASKLQIQESNAELKRVQEQLRMGQALTERKAALRLLNPNSERLMPPATSGEGAGQLLNPSQEPYRVPLPNFSPARSPHPQLTKDSQVILLLPPGQDQITVNGTTYKVRRIKGKDGKFRYEITLNSKKN
jgi:beta-lactamase regulating signal transducer with metallopeptidase domain